MKKMLGGVFALLVLVSATGCFNNNSSNGADITCTKEEDGTNYVYGATFDGDKLVKLVTEQKDKYEDEEALEFGRSFAKLAESAYEGEEGISVEIKENNLELNIVITYDLNKMGTELLENSFGKSVLTKKDFNELATEDGYTCK